MKTQNTKTGMEQYQEWFTILESRGFKRVRNEVGNVDYKHPKRYKYRIKFDWGTFHVVHRFTHVYSVFEIDLGRLNMVIDAILNNKAGSALIVLEKMKKERFSKKEVIDLCPLT